MSVYVYKILKLENVCLNKVPARNKEIHVSAHDCNVGCLCGIKSSFDVNIGKIVRHTHTHTHIVRFLRFFCCNFGTVKDGCPWVDSGKQ
jgi:hypothetical protein